MSMSDLSKDLLEELECLVCLEYMLPPIILCENGHNICNSCKPKLEQCPTCQQAFLKARNVALEKLAVKVECPCRNKQYGCTLSFPLPLLRQHQNECEHNPYYCPLWKSLKCKWMGSLNQMKEHITQDHKEWVTDMSGRRVVYIKKFSKELKYYRVILVNNDIFYQQFEVLQSTFYYMIRYVGPEEMASQYKYELILGNGDEKISASNITSSNKTNVNKVYRSGKCVKLYYDTIERFLDENKSLKFAFEISKIKGNRSTGAHTLTKA